MSPEERAKAVAERFATELPSRSGPELERIVTSAIKRALGQQLAELEDSRPFKVFDALRALPMA